MDLSAGPQRLSPPRASWPSHSVVAEKPARGVPAAHAVALAPLSRLGRGPIISTRPSVLG
jgi:hypothetical protein